MAKADREKASGRGCSILGTVVLLFAAFVGYRAVSSAFEGRRNDAALARDGVRVTGVIVDHSSAGRRQSYRPTVKYVVEGREYKVRAQTGFGIKEALERPVGTPLDVIHLPEDPNVAEIVGYEFRTGIGAILAGSLFLILPLAALAFLIRMGVLFGKRAAEYGKGLPQ